MISCLFIGDPHFKVDNIPEVDIFLEKLEKLIQERKPDFICVAGDILHTHERLHTIPLNKAYEFIQMLRKYAKTYVLVGNHDYCNNSQFLSVSHWMNGMKEWEDVVIVDKVESFEENDKTFVFVPYVPPGRFIEALNSTETDWTTATCIFAHQEFYGCKMGAIVSVEGDKWSEDFPLVVSGHIHSKQRPQENVYYSGSAMQHAFGESEKNILAFIRYGDEFEGGYDLEEVDLCLPRKRMIYADVSKMEELTIKPSQDKIKVVVSGVYEEFKAFKKTKKYKETIKKGIRVVFKPKRADIKKEEIEAVNNADFSQILHGLIQKEKNKHLEDAYEFIVNNRGEI